MAKRSQAQVRQLALNAGFSQADATILTAIAGAESGYNDQAVGDVGLENATWGPSVGLFQVRTLKAQTGTGTDRDINWLRASDANQAKAAYDISRGGRDWSPWTTYTNGAYQAFLPGGTPPQPAGAAGSGSSSATLTSSPGPLTTIGDLLTAPFANFKGLVLTGAGLVLALGLVLAGALVIGRPYVQRAKQKTEKAAGTAAQVAAVAA